MNKHNITKDVFIDIAMPPVAAGSSDTTTGVIIDTLGYESIVFVAHVGTLTSTAVTGLKIKHGNDSGLSDGTDVAGSATSIPQADGSNKGWLSKEIHRPTKRYLQLVVTRGTANAVVNGAIVLMSRGDRTPPAIGASMGNVTPTVLVSPVTGTA